MRTESAAIVIREIDELPEMREVEALQEGITTLYTYCLTEVFGLFASMYASSFLRS